MRFLFLKPAFTLAILAAVGAVLMAWAGGFYNKGIRKASRVIVQGNLERAKTVRELDGTTANRNIDYEKQEADIRRFYGE